MTAAKVLLYGNVIGYLRWDERRAAALFEYDSSFVGKGLEPSPLLMPVRSGISYCFGDLRSETFRGLPGMFADSLPDRYGRALMQTYLQLLKRREENPVEALCFLGSRCMGALEFQPAFEHRSASADRFEMDSLVEVAREALEQKEHFATQISEDRKQAIADVLSLSTSAGGQRAKAVIAYNVETGEIRSGQVDAPAGFEHYLIKLDGVSQGVGITATQNYGRSEYSFYLLAKRCGIQMNECSLLEEDGRAHFLTKRFDRVGNRKIHMQTLCGMAHYDFNFLRSYSYEQAFEVMRALHLTYQEMQEMYRRVVFNVVVRNQDDHTKNISFLMDEKGQWQLSPAYDMGYNYNPQGGWASQHQMSVNGKFDNINREDLLALAHHCDIDRAEDTIDSIVETCSHWDALAVDCGIPADFINRRFPNFQRI